MHLQVIDLILIGLSGLLKTFVNVAVDCLHVSEVSLTGGIVIRQCFWLSNYVVDVRGPFRVEHLEADAEGSHRPRKATFRTHCWSRPQR